MHQSEKRPEYSNLQPSLLLFKSRQKNKVENGDNISLIGSNIFLMMVESTACDLFVL